MPRVERPEAKEFREKLLKLIERYNGKLTGYAISIILCLEENGEKIPSDIMSLKLPKGVLHDSFMAKNARVSKHLRRMEALGRITHKTAESGAPQDKKLWSIMRG